MTDSNVIITGPCYYREGTQSGRPEIRRRFDWAARKISTSRRW